MNPLEELLLEDHIDANNKLLAFEPDRGYPGGEVERLIDQNNWAGLLASINNDRQLSTDSFKQRPVIPGAFKGHTKEAVWTGMDKVREKYFTKTKGANMYKISKYAREIDVKETPGIRK